MERRRGEKERRWRLVRIVKKKKKKRDREGEDIGNMYIKKERQSCLRWKLD